MDHTELLQQHADLKKATESKIAALMQERTDLVASTEKRTAEIADALKALGHKKPRQKKTVVADPPPAA